jgi:hypothetical protein
MYLEEALAYFNYQDFRRKRVRKISNTPVNIKVITTWSIGKYQVKYGPYAKCTQDRSQQ